MIRGKDFELDTIPDEYGYYSKWIRRKAYYFDDNGALCIGTIIEVNARTYHNIDNKLQFDLFFHLVDDATLTSCIRSLEKIAESKLEIMTRVFGQGIETNVLYHLVDPHNK